MISTAFLVFILFVDMGFCGTLIVGKGEKFRTIRDALLAAKPGDTIRVKKGIYYGNIVITTDNISLIGEDWPIIQGEKKGNAVTIKAKHVLFKGFVVKGGGFSLLKDEAGIKLINAEGSKVIGNRLIDNLHGIYLFQSPKCIVSKNFIHGRDYLQQEKRGNGIHLWNSNFCIIRENELEYTRDGFYVSFSHYCHLDRNYIHNVRYGIHYMYSNHNYFDENVLFHNVAGLALMFGKYFYFKKNIVAHNRGFRAYGILWQDAIHAHSMENLVYDNSIGLYFDHSEICSVEKNWVINNDIGVVVLSSSEEIEFYENNFINNLTLLQVRGGKARNNYFYSRDKKVGNYWSQYRGYDLNMDGIGDVPFPLINIYDDLTADYPEFRLFYLSPLAKALQLAEKVFPILEVPQYAVDLYPLVKPAKIDFSPLEILKYEGKGKEVKIQRFIMALIFSLLLLACLFVLKKSYEGG